MIRTFLVATKKYCYTGFDGLLLKLK